MPNPDLSGCGELYLSCLIQTYLAMETYETFVSCVLMRVFENVFLKSGPHVKYISTDATHTRESFIIVSSEQGRLEVLWNRRQNGEVDICR